MTLLLLNQKYFYEVTGTINFALCYREYLLRVYGLGLKSVECIRLLALEQKAFPVSIYGYIHFFIKVRHFWTMLINYLFTMLFLGGCKCWKNSGAIGMGSP